ncbi:MAG: phosphatase PAP2 family protein [Rhodoglobus sp.]
MNPPPKEALSPERVARFWPLVSAAAALLVVGGIGLVILYREHNKPFGFELEWMGEIVEHRSPFWTVPALVFNAIGGGLIAIAVVPVLIIVALLLWRRRWAALYFLISVAVSPLIVELLKKVFGRPRPTDILVTSDFGSFPSGHSANAALIATVLGIVLARRWIWIAGACYTIAMMLSRTYLGAHWISDTVGGALIGVGVAVIVWAPFAAVLTRERMLPHPPPWRRRTPVSP